jgi:hypothetical protein
MASGCEGFVSPQPTMMISLPQAFPYLRVFFIASDPARNRPGAAHARRPLVLRR